MATPVDGRWEPGIGDPTIIGWFTVAAYTVGAVLCYTSYRRARNKPSRQFWFYMALVMLALGVNKQLDLQTWFTQTGRDLALEYGWYERRRIVQFIFIAWLASCGVLVISWLRGILHQLGRAAKWAGVGLALLIGFVIVRATSFHHVDRMLGLSLEGLRVNALLELGGIGMIAWAALSNLRMTQAGKDVDLQLGREMRDHTHQGRQQR